MFYLVTMATKTDAPKLLIILSAAEAISDLSKTRHFYVFCSQFFFQHRLVMFFLFCIGFV